MPVPEHHNLKSAAIVRLDIEANAVVDAQLLDDNEGIVPSRCSSCGGRGTHVANCSVASRRKAHLSVAAEMRIMHSSGHLISVLMLSLFLTVIIIFLRYV